MPHFNRTAIPLKLSLNRALVYCLMTCFRDVGNSFSSVEFSPGTRHVKMPYCRNASCRVIPRLGSTRRKIFSAGPRLHCAATCDTALRIKLRWKQRIPVSLGGARSCGRNIALLITLQLPERDQPDSTEDSQLNIWRWLFLTRRYETSPA